MVKYNWQLKNWPNFQYDQKKFSESLLECISLISRLAGKIEALPQSSLLEGTSNLMLTEAIKNSAIEGEMLNRGEVMSSIQNRLGLPSQSKKEVKDIRAAAMGELMVLAYKSYADDFSLSEINNWHRILFQGQKYIENIGSFRTHEEEMLIESGFEGKRKVHFKAPPSSRVEKEMQAFETWFKTTEIKEAPIKAAIAHLYFESIHPYEDGNGRLGRIIAEKALIQKLEKPILIGLSREIESNKKAYYAAIEEAQASNEITNWICFFIETINSAIKTTQEEIDFIIVKTKFFDSHSGKLNERQLKVCTRILQEGPLGFDGGMTAKKYMAITKCSKATATRDLQDLVKKDIFLAREAGGRSQSYDLNLS